MAKKTDEKKLSYELLGAHTDKAGKFFPRGSVIILTLEEAKEPCFENKLKRIIDDSQNSEILLKATAQAEKQASEIVSNAEKEAKEILAKANKKAKEVEDALKEAKKEKKNTSKLFEGGVEG
jgi:hypothetical protein